MSYREGRGRSQRDYPLRLDEQSHRGRGSNPPSRHLWVGNIPGNITENELAHYFLRFGNIESIAFQPGRSYAFINYRREEEAFDALKELQGFTIGGNQLNIQFAKAEKSLKSAHNVEYSSRRDDVRSMPRENSFNMRDSRGRDSNLEASYINKSKTSGKDSEPSEVLWIGFPEGLKVDEYDLRKAFTSFGEIEKITAFPGRTYAFVRFRNIRSSCRAKETLQGKLFGDPRVNIFFARNESGGSSRERNSTNAPLSPHVRSYERSRSPERIRYDRKFGSMPSNLSSRSPPYMPNVDTYDEAGMGNLWPTGNVVHEQRRFPRQEPDSRLTSNIYNRPISPSRDMSAHFDEFAPQKFRRQGPPGEEDPWDLPEDVSFLHETKKLRRDPFPPDDHLPEYPLSDMGNVKDAHTRDIHQSGVFNKRLDSRTPGRELVPDRFINPKQPFGEWSDNRNLPIDNSRVASSSLLQPNRTNEPSSQVVWKWEGMIAKVGNPVCRARCFPVGKPMEMALPEYIDCTSKTSLDMLAKQYNEASSAWVVFFVPADDRDIPYYNEFMNFLGEKQRAAVAILDQQTSLFLVAPSEFSENVLKVPGRLSISGVALRFGPTNGQLYNNNEAALTSSQGKASFQSHISQSQPYMPVPIVTNYEKPGTYVAPSAGSSHSMSSAREFDELRHDHFQKPPPGPILSDHSFLNHTYSSIPERMQEASRNHYIPEMPPRSHGSTTASVTHAHSSIPERMQEAPRTNYTPEIPPWAHGSATASANHAYSSIPERMQEAPRTNYTPEMPPGGHRSATASVNHTYSSIPERMQEAPRNNYTPEMPPGPHGSARASVNHAYPSIPEQMQEPPSNNYTPEMPRGVHGSATISVNHSYSIPGRMQEAPRNNYTQGVPDVPVSGNGNELVHSSMPDVPASGNGNQLVQSSMPVAGIETLAQLASSLLGQRNQFSGMPSAGEYMPSGNINHLRHSNETQNSSLPANGQISSGSVPPVSGAVQPLPQVATQREVAAVSQVNQQVQNVGQEDQGDDSQRRLQATLQLAASLLQQVQQGRRREN